MVKYKLSSLKPVGSLYKSSGIRGFLICDFSTFMSESYSKLDYIFLKDKGQAVPYFIEEIINKGDLLIKLEGVDSPEDAKLFSNKEILLDQDKLDSLGIDESKALPPLIGYTLFNNSIKIGEIVELEEYPSQRMIHVVDESDQMHMIPLVEEWIIDVDTEEQIFTMEFDMEILDLN